MCMYITQLLCPFAGLLTPGIDTRPRQAEASAMLVSLSWKGRSMIVGVTGNYFTIFVSPCSPQSSYHF